MSSKEWYRDWFNSPFYHKLYFERDEDEAKKFIRSLIDHLSPPPGCRMVDVACGRGRHSIFLSQLGFDVTGIDLSMDSINFAKQFENEHLHFYQHDMRLPAWINFFDYAFNFFTSFGYFSTRREHDDAVSTIVKSLKKNGVVLFDYLNVHYVEDHLIHNETKNVNGTSYEIHRWMDQEHFFKKIIVHDANLNMPCDYTEKVAKLSLGDFTDMLSFQGMQVTEVFGDYNFSSYDVKKTPRMIIVARKDFR
jgi:SAM-dependent methyltransferase